MTFESRRIRPRVSLCDRALLGGAKGGAARWARALHASRGFFLTVIAALFAHGSAAAEAEMDLATLRAALQSTLSSISSVDVKYDLVRRQHAGPLQGEADAVEIHEWAEQGEWRLYSTTYPDSKREPFSLSFDGAHGYEYSWEQRGGRPTRLVITKDTNAGYWSAEPPIFIGLREERGGPGLAEQLASPRARLVGHEDVRGSRCWKALIAPVNVPAGPHQLTVLLDSEHDFLPAEIDRRHFADDPNDYPDEPLRKKPFQRWIVEEFMRVMDHQTGSERWFPKRVRREMGLAPDVFTSVEFAVNSVDLNAALSIDRFRITPPAGTYVEDVTTPGRINGHFVGGNAASDDLVQRAARAAIAELKSRDARSSQYAAVIDARPKRARWPRYQGDCTLSHLPSKTFSR